MPRVCATAQALSRSISYPLKHVVRFRPKLQPMRRQGVKAMTIAAGLQCTDGVIICADTEHTQGNAKFERTKIWAAGDYLLLTGAGSSDHMKMAFDKLAHKFVQARPDNPHVARAVVEKLVRDLHEQHIYPLYQVSHPYAQDVSIWLIVAIRCANGELALIKTELTAAILVDDYEAVGAGNEIFKYWAKHFRILSMDMEVTGYFSLFMLREAKTASAGSGGSSYLFKMPKDLHAPRAFRHMFSDDDILAGFPDSAVKVLLCATDTKLGDSVFESQLSLFRVLVSQLRGAVKSGEQMLARARLVPTGEVSPNVPEQPPEQSGGAVPAKAVRRARRRP